jgi:hypothetical protein
MNFWRAGSIALAGAALIAGSPAMAHCDGLDGPVVGAARTALDSGDPNAVLVWVQPKDEAEIRAAFRDAVAVRKLGPAAQQLADRYFFETLVRVHRAGEGAPYTGLKPAGRDLGPAIPLADAALTTRSERELTDFVAKQATDGIRTRFADIQRKRNFRSEDIAAGRDYVASYVSFIHYVEGLHQAATGSAEGHYADAEAGSAAHAE